MTATRRRAVEVPAETGVICAVAPDSLAAELDLQPGDRILSVNGRPLRDPLDFQFHAESDMVSLEVQRGQEITLFEVERELDEVWGVTFADPTFDGIHLCDNQCPFCFIKQMPRGMRRSLYVMDDDYRYSMLYGNFITLTNLTEEDWQRIEEQHISPINVSVHATNPELRVKLVGNPRAALIMEHLARLEQAGIDYNAQLVLCPGVNDGPELDRTVRDLLTLGPHLRSIAGVPVGLSKFGEERQSRRVRLSRTCMRSLPEAMLDVRRYRPDEAAAVIAQAERWQEWFRAERGRTFLQLGDEFYLMVGRDVPAASTYDGFPQVEDGIGITRLFVDDAERLIRRGPREDVRGAPAAIACGTLIEPTMRRLVDGLNARAGTRLRVVPIVNTFFGAEISASGLLTGGMVADAFREDPESDPVFVSHHMLSKRTQTFLDDLHIEDLQAQLARPVIAAEYLSQVVKQLTVPRPQIVLGA